MINKDKQKKGGEWKEGKLINFLQTLPTIPEGW